MSFFKPKRGSMKTLYIALGVILAIVAALKLHINLKFLIFPLAAAVIYIYRTEVGDYWKSNVWPYAESRGITSFHAASLAVKLLYVGLGAVPVIILAVKLHINLKFLIIPLAAAMIYLYRTALYSFWNNNALPFAQKHGVTNFRDSSFAAKVFYILAGSVPVFIAAVKFHVKLKFMLFLSGAAVLYVAFPPLYDYYQSNAFSYGQNGTSENFDDAPGLTNIQYIAIGIILVFIVAYELHIKFLMYPLAAAIFYLYVPLLYAVGRKSALLHVQQGEPAYHSYPWFTVWFTVASVFSYMLSHLLADLISGFHLSFFRYVLYAFILLTAGGLGVIGYLQWQSKKIALLGDLRTNFETQGRLAGFEILFMLLIYFLVKH
jgi:hypothetical protein